MKVLNISIFLLIWSFSGKSFASPPKKDVFVSALPLCFCLAVNGGIMTSEYHTVGVNYYSGGLPMAGGGTQYGLFSRLHPWESSFFITTRFGYMESSWGHPDFVHTLQVANAGFAIMHCCTPIWMTWKVSLTGWLRRSRG